MIDIHKIMVESVAMMPLVGGTKPVYEFGDEYHLNQIMKMYAKDQKNIFPLIYNVSNKTTQDSARNKAYSKVSLVIATRNLHTEYKNTQRWATSYKNVLFPVVELLEMMFDRSAVLYWERTSDIFEFPNYGNFKENETTDIWDALRFEADITVTDNCSRPIKFT